MITDGVPRPIRIYTTVVTVTFYNSILKYGLDIIKEYQ